MALSHLYSLRSNAWSIKFVRCAKIGCSMHRIWLTARSRYGTSRAAPHDGTLNVRDRGTYRPLASIALDSPIACISLASDSVIIIVSDRSGNVHCLRCCDPSDKSVQPTP